MPLRNSSACFMFICCLSIASQPTRAASRPDIDALVNAAVVPMLQRYDIPGVAVAISVDGKGHFYQYGVASKATGEAITRDTLFEIGSISKTFTATLAAYAQAQGKLALTDHVARYLPDLRGSSFGALSLVQLGTHASGELPLQVPDYIKDMNQLMSYLKAWSPDRVPGTYRSYSNVSVGMLGVIAAGSMQSSMSEAIEKTLFPLLGMRNSYVRVPTARMKDYAQGYTKDGAPIRMAPGLLADEAYGVRTCATDMLAYIQANLSPGHLDSVLQQALLATRTGYYRAGAMTQDLIWEQYPYPGSVASLLAGNSDSMSLQPNAITELKPALLPQSDVLINKTGSTNGFAAYVAFIPSRKIGIVLLANRNYPNAARVTAAHAILTGIDRMLPDASRN